jgi:hypothetical protein
MMKSSRLRLELIAVNADDVAIVVNVRGAAASERLTEIGRVLDGVGARLYVFGRDNPRYAAALRLLKL